MEVHVKRSVSNVLGIISLLMLINFAFAFFDKFAISFGQNSHTKVLIFSIGCAFILALIAVLFNPKNIFSWITFAATFVIISGMLLMVLAFWDSY